MIMTTKEIKEYLRLENKLFKDGKVIKTGFTSDKDVNRYRLLLPKFIRLKKTIVNDAIIAYRQINNL